MKLVDVSRMPWVARRVEYLRSSGRAAEIREEVSRGLLPSYALPPEERRQFEAREAAAAEERLRRYHWLKRRNFPPRTVERAMRRDAL